MLSKQKNKNKKEKPRKENSERKTQKEKQKKKKTKKENPERKPRKEKQKKKNPKRKNKFQVFKRSFLFQEQCTQVHTSVAISTYTAVSEIKRQQESFAQNEPSPDLEFPPMDFRKNQNSETS